MPSHESPKNTKEPTTPSIAKSHLRRTIKSLVRKKKLTVTALCDFVAKDLAIDMEPKQSTATCVDKVQEHMSDKGIYFKSLLVDFSTSEFGGFHDPYPISDE